MAHTSDSARTARKLLIGILGLSFGIECLFPIGGFMLPEKTLEIFQVGVTNDTRFLAFIASWCLLFVAIICGLALRWVLRGDPRGWTLSYILGLWWVGIGGSLFLVYGRVDNLFLDGVKGALLTAAAYASRPRDGVRHAA
jgi:hypothetical protein